MNEPILDVTINFELTNGNGAGKRKNRRQQTKQEACIELKKAFGREPPKIRGYRVVLRIDRILGPRQVLWDSGNILAGNAKQLIDALVSVGIITDDNNKYVTEPVLSGQIHDNRRIGPATRIRIWREKDAMNSTLKELR
tara:strand:+ start:605 stop:1021 length:417 start_codon:yes stop_codon:yes gene_type:complete